MKAMPLFFLAVCFALSGLPGGTHASVTLIETFAGEGRPGGIGYPAREIGDFNGDDYGDWAAWTDERSLNIYYGGNPPDTIPDLVIREHSFLMSDGTAYLAGRCDLNGDGYGDIALAAGSPSQVHIYLGSASPDSERDLLLEAGEPRFLAAAGDINADTYSDLMTSNFDSTYIYFGAGNPDNAPDLLIARGVQIAGVGDINDDGYDDFAVGRDPTSIFLGDSLPDAVPDIALPSFRYVSQKAQQSIAGSGDFNGDGYDDVAIGYPSFDNPETGGGYDGQVSVYFGGAPMDTVADWVNEWTGGEFGFAVAFVGDITENGYEDLVVGAPYSAWGRAYLFQGGSSPSLDPHVTFAEGAGDQNLGYGIGRLGDINGDIVDDILLSPSSDELYVRAYYGGAGIDSLPDLEITDEVGHQLGYAVSEGHDLNGDEYDDWAIGVPYRPELGGSYVYFGGPVLDTVRDLTLVKESLFGMDLDWAGDIKGAGFDCLLCRRDICGNAAYVYFGGSPMDSISDKTLSTEPHCGDAGTAAMAPAGDFNGDGYDDVLIGIGSFFGPGWTELYLGGVPFNKAPDAFFCACECRGGGFECAGAGDINGDIYADVAIGRTWETDTSGVVSVYLGHADPDSFPQPDIVLEIQDVGFGAQVSFAGDVNGDSYEDLMVSTSSSIYYDGDVYLYYCSPAMDTLPDLVIPAAGPNSGFGAVIEPLGDIDGDTYDDIAIGAPLDAGYKGRVYIFLGGNPMDNIADIVLEGEHTEDRFGFSIAGLGDVNGDDETEILIGAPGHADEFGKAYMYAGSRAGAEPWAPGDSRASILKTKPNPFLVETVITFNTPKSTRVGLKVYDVRGRHVRTLVDGVLPAGIRTASWDGLDSSARPAAPGVYFIELRAGTSRDVNRVVFLK
jgi:hypothetical protein